MKQRDDGEHQQQLQNLLNYLDDLIDMLSSKNCRLEVDGVDVKHKIIESLKDEAADIIRAKNNMR